MKPTSTSSTRNTVIHRDWTQGSISHNLWSLSWPMLINNLLNSIGPMVDLIWIGSLGASAIAGVGTSGLVVMVVQSLISGLFTGTVALVARRIGARDEEGANHAAQQAFVVGMVFSLLMAFVGIFLAKPFMQSLGLDASVVEEGTAYMRIQLIGIFTMTMLQIGQSLMQASGDAIQPMIIVIGYRLLQIVLCPALIFGWGFFPRLEVSGASLSNVITQGLGGAIALYILFTGRTRIKVSLKKFAFDGKLIWTTTKIGIPSSFSMMQRSISELIIMWFIVPFGTAAVAAQSVSTRVDQFIQMMPGGMGSAASVLAGQSLGAKDPKRAERTGWLAVLFTTVMSFVGIAVIWLWVVPILGIFTKDTEVIRIAATFLRIMTIGYIVWGAVITFSQVLNGVGDTMVQMLANLASMVLVQLALAYVLANYTSLGVNGIRWAAVAGIMVRALIYSTYFKSGRWKRKML
jgi:putative MATE family efflux protein